MGSDLLQAARGQERQILYPCAPRVRARHGHAMILLNTEVLKTFSLLFKHIPISWVSLFLNSPCNSWRHKGFSSSHSPCLTSPLRSPRLLWSASSPQSKFYGDPLPNIFSPTLTSHPRPGPSTFHPPSQTFSCLPPVKGSPPQSFPRQPRNSPLYIRLFLPFLRISVLPGLSGSA